MFSRRRQDSPHGFDGFPHSACIKIGVRVGRSAGGSQRAGRFCHTCPQRRESAAGLGGTDLSYVPHGRHGNQGGFTNELSPLCS